MSVCIIELLLPESVIRIQSSHIEISNLQRWAKRSSRRHKMTCIIAKRARFIAHPFEVRRDPDGTSRLRFHPLLLPQESLVLGDPHLLPVHDARPLGSGPVSVVGMLLHVELGESALLLVIGLLLRVAHRLPPSSQDLGDVGIVHVRTRFQDLPPLVLGPHHERVHRSLHVWTGFPVSVTPSPLTNDFGSKDFA